MAQKDTKKATKPKGIAFYSKKYGISSDKLRKVYKRGMGAYYSSGSRAFEYVVSNDPVDQSAYYFIY